MERENYISVRSWTPKGKDFAGEIEVSRDQLDSQQIITVEIPDGRELKVKLSPPLEGCCLRFQGLINRGRRDLFLNVKVYGN